MEATREGGKVDGRQIDPSPLEAGGPFVLCDDGRDGCARLFTQAVEIVQADTIDDVLPALDRIAGAAARGLHAAGFLAYESGYALESRLRPLGARLFSGLPLVWFGLFADVRPLAADEVARHFPDPAGATAVRPEPGISRAEYEARVGDAAELIAAGDIYQANLSFPNEVRFAGHPLALYAAIRSRARAGWGGALFTGEHWLLSASPELFFTLENGHLTARPMKGTAARMSDPAADTQAAAVLAADPKQRAENLMIVDLLRNDLSRVSVAGSVNVPSLFEVETYPTVHTMTSTVEAQLSPGLGPVNVLRAMFPCGSITGAPKIRAMQVIADAEHAARGAYTGSMGWMAPDGDAAFDVLIRTLTVAHGSDRGTLGLGAGIVADSRPDDEWNECLSKGAFVCAGQPRFDLVETMRFDPQDGLPDLDLHLERLGASAAALGFAFDRHRLRNDLQAATFRLGEPRAVRLRLARGGAVAIVARSMPQPQAEPVSVALRALPVAAHDFRLRHKTSDRRFYDAARRDGGMFEAVFVDPDGFLTEGSFTAVFVDQGGVLLTPPLTRGLLPGVLRARLIAQGHAREAELRPADLTGGFWIGNALRELIAARLA